MRLSAGLIYLISMRPVFNKIFASVILLIFLLFTNLCQVIEVDEGEETPPDNDAPLTTELIQPGDLTYRGAFRLPDTGSADVVETWAWGGYAMTHNINGDINGGNDGYPGSLFATGHAWQHQISEITIPQPKISNNKNLAELNVATTLQPFRDIYDLSSWEMPRVGLQFLPKQGSQSTAKLYLCWGGHLVESGHLTHAWCETTLSAPQKKGDWYLNVSHYEYNSNDYLFQIPANWASTHLQGKALATGRYRDGGWSGEGPAIFAIGPWQDGNPPANGQALNSVTLLKYSSSADSDAGSHTMNNYHHSDEWTGGAWITSGNKGAVIFAGTKGKGDCWYGDENGPCLDCDGERGWWSSEFEGQVIFYNPADLAEVAKGNKESWKPQPYAVLEIDSSLYHIRSKQQWYHTAAIAFDRENGLLYILEPLVDDDKPIVHVWKVN